MEERNDRRVALNKTNYQALQAAAGDRSSMAEYLNVLLAQVLQPISLDPNLSQQPVPLKTEKSEAMSRLKVKNFSLE